MERNRKLFYQIADLIETYPEMHDQETWGSPVRSKKKRNDKFDTIIFDGEEIKCGTSHCIAGWALALDKEMKPAVYKEASPFGGEKRRVINWSNAQHNDGTWIPTPCWAASKLGITEEESDMLFSEEWSPRHGISVADALREFADGASIYEITGEFYYQ